MKAKKKFRVGLVGTDSLRGNEIKTMLSVKRFPLTHIEFYDPDVKQEYSKLTQFQDEARVIQHLQPALLEGLDLVFLASDKETNRLCGKFAKAKKFLAIDLSEAYAGEKDVPPIVAGVNDQLLKKKRFPLISNPHPVTIILSSLFHGLIHRFGVARAVAFVLQPASVFDRPGIEELADQSAAILSSSSIKKNLFREQVAFNFLSYTEKPGVDGFSSGERRIIAEIKRVLDDPAFPLSLSIVQAPVFHTYSIMAYLELIKKATIPDLESLYGENPLFKIGETGTSRPISSISVAGKEQIFIGQIKKEEAFPNTFWIWTVTDNLTRGSALNALEIASIIFSAKPEKPPAS